MFGKKRATKEMTVVQVLSESPLARGILLKYGIKFIGQSLSPLESLEKVAKGNGLGDKDVEKMLEELNREQPKRSGNIIELTETAGARLREMIKNRGKKGIRFRLVSDGCSSYIYDMDFGTRRVGDEIEFKTNGVTFYVEPKSANFIRGTKIDYNAKEEGFVFENPNVKR